MSNPPSIHQVSPTPLLLQQGYLNSQQICSRVTLKDRAISIHLCIKSADRREQPVLKQCAASGQLRSAWRKKRAWNTPNITMNKFSTTVFVKLLARILCFTWDESCVSLSPVWGGSVVSVCLFPATSACISARWTRSAWGQEIINLELIEIWEFCHQTIISFVSHKWNYETGALDLTSWGTVCVVKQSANDREDVFWCEARQLNRFKDACEKSDSRKTLLLVVCLFNGYFS